MKNLKRLALLSALIVACSGILVTRADGDVMRASREGEGGDMLLPTESALAALSPESRKRFEEWKQAIADWVNSTKNLTQEERHERVRVDLLLNNDFANIFKTQEEREAASEAGIYELRDQIVRDAMEAVGVTVRSYGDWVRAQIRKQR